MSRFLELILAVAAMIITLPFWIIIIILIIIFSPGCPFFWHRRIGQNGREFQLIKFRTMLPSTSGDLQITTSRDTRITGIGKILRRWKLDELPQLLNIISGDMTFVGPRPEFPAYAAGYSQAQKEILRYKPGLVDPATLKYRHEERLLAGFENPEQVYMEKVLPDKIGISLEYQKRRNLGSDLRIILCTFRTIFQKP